MVLQSLRKGIRSISEARVDLSRLSSLGRHVGLRFFQLYWLRERSYKIEQRIVPMLHFLQTVIWKEMTGKPADSLEKSTDRDNECEYFPPHEF